jgi:hypothetical protein
MVNNKQLLSEKAVTLSQQFLYRYKKYNGETSQIYVRKRLTGRVLRKNLVDQFELWNKTL